ncbi:MAG: alpha/beta hydrolase [Kineosporiaceae bacterium]
MSAAAVGTTDGARGVLDVSFRSEGVVCRGWLFTPEGAPPADGWPAVVTANAFSSVKEIHMSAVGERLAAAGIAVLVFDYRTLGASDGEPRQQIVPHDQLDDLRNAVSWIRARDDVDADRIGLWGVSLGGGHVLHLAAFDPRVRAVVAVLPAINQWRNFLSAMPREAFRGFLTMVTDARQAAYGTDDVAYLPLVAPPPDRALMPPEAYAFYTQAQRTTAPNWRNEVAVSSLEHFVAYDPAGAVELISPSALLLIAAAEDAVIPLSLIEDAYSRAGEPRRLLTLPCGHTDVYQVEPHRNRALAAAAEWFGSHL